MQREYFGAGSIGRLGKIISDSDTKNILLVAGKHSFTACSAEKKVVPLLSDFNYNIFFSSPNPEITNIRKGIKIFRKIRPDMVIGIGGGSALDTAKLINGLAPQKQEPLSYIIGEEKLTEEVKPVIAIPTTAGSGSESTRFAALFINKKKYSLEDKKILPTVAIVDPALTISMPPYLTACTGLDALCQSIESFWSINSTKESRAYAKRSIELAIVHIEKAVKNPTLEDRIAMAKAAHLSGKAINIAKTTACHSISYPLTSFFGIPHGHAVSLTMPSFLEFNAQVNAEDCNDPRGVEFVRKKMETIFSLLNTTDALGAKIKFGQLIDSILNNVKLADFNIRETAMETILKEGFTPNRMNNNPRKVSKEALKKILTEIL